MPQNKEDLPLSLAEINQGRAHIYQWFSHQFQAELTETQWQALATDQLSPFFELLAENGLTTEVEAYLSAVKRLLETKGAAARVILASDFAHAFLLSGQDSALPYAAAYDANAEGMLYGVTAQVMQQFLSGVGLTLSGRFKEPEDHLAVYLAVLSHLANNSSLVEQEQFIEQALSSWLPDFVAKCQTLNLQSQVYPHLAQLLMAFIKQDQLFLVTKQ